MRFGATMLNKTSAFHEAPSPSQTNINGGLVLGRIGPLVARLIGNERELERAQQLRHQVFIDEFPEQKGRALEALDSDPFDVICDHLIVLDERIDGTPHEQIVATYRFLPQARAAQQGGFYTEGEFAINALIARHPSRNFLELGRSCVLQSYRSKRTIELLWQGIWAYSLQHNIDVMTGCASFAGVDPSAHALSLSYLHHYHSADEHWHAAAHSDRFHAMDLMPKDAIAQRQAIAALPPLIKGYLRLGAMVGHGCVVDEAFGSIDVLILLPVEKIAPRYLRHYGENAERFAA